MKNPVVLFDVNTKEERKYLVSDRIKRMLDSLKDSTDGSNLFVIEFGKMAREVIEC